jgi:hypothetical protein
MSFVQEMCVESAFSFFRMILYRILCCIIEFMTVTTALESTFNERTWVVFQRLLRHCSLNCWTSV